MTKKLKPREKPHYVNNREFSYAVVDYVKSVHEAEGNDKVQPKVNDHH